MKKFIFLLVFVLLLMGCTKEKYNIKFVDWDNTVIKELNLSENDQITPPQNPTREGYVFVGWDKKFDKVSENLVIKAVYEQKSFTVTFKGFNGEILKEENVLYGMDATQPNITIPSGYKFDKWDKTFTNVKEDLIINAMFEKLTFTVKFMGLNNELIIEETVDYGASATEPNINVPNGYKFIKWDKGYIDVKENLVVNAVFEKLTYSVKFLGLNDELIKEETVEFGASATAPIVEGTLDFQFSKWDREYINIQSDLIVKAIYVEREYLIQFYEGNTELFFGISKYKRSDNLVLPIPTKNGYEFSGWFLSNISLYEVDTLNSKFYGDLKLYSRWVKTEQNILTAPTNAIEFDGIIRNPHSSGVGFVYQPKFPAGVPSTSVLQYDWASSNEKIAKISAYSSISIVSSGYAIITATSKTDPNYVLYCVINTSVDGVTKATLEEANATNYVYATFNFEDGTKIKKVVAKGGYVIPPTASTKEGFVFVGWEGTNGEKIYNITKDTTFNAKYIEGTKSYAGKTVSVLGDSISTYSGYIPDGFAYFYPYPTADLSDVNQTWWMQLINHYGMKLLANNSWSGSAVSGTAASAAQNKDRLKHLFIGNITPDVIVIFMGANDTPSQYITLEQFDESYGKMIQNIKEMSPNSEIVVCTLPSINLYTQSAQDEYNGVILKHANANGFNILDFRTAFNRQDVGNYLVDSAHPNLAGMNKLAEVAINDFLK